MSDEKKPKKPVDPALSAVKRIGNILNTLDAVKRRAVLAFFQAQTPAE